MTDDDIRTEFAGLAPPKEAPEAGEFIRHVHTCVARESAELRNALQACVEVMQALPTLNGAYGLSVLEHAIELLELLPIIEPRPVNMLLYCPNCGHQHIDEPKLAIGWFNEPHRSHLCGYCHWQWRPSDTPTNGVAAIGTRSKADSEGTPAMPRDAARWRYTQRRGYFALPPIAPGDLWAVGIGSTQASNSYYGPTLEAAIDTALMDEQ